MFLGFWHPEFTILSHLRILAFQNPEFKILAVQNPEFNILADFRV